MGEDLDEVRLEDKVHPETPGRQRLLWLRSQGWLGMHKGKGGRTVSNKSKLTVTSQNKVAVVGRC